MIRQFVLQELEKQKAKLAVDQEKEETNSNKVRSPIKRKSKLTNRSFRENYKRMKKFMRDKIRKKKKNIQEKMDNNRKKAKRDNLDDNQIKQLRIYEKNLKKVMRDDLDDNEKEHLRKEDIERKNERRVTWRMMREIS